MEPIKPLLSDKALKRITIVWVVLMTFFLAGCFFVGFHFLQKVW